MCEYACKERMEEEVREGAEAFQKNLDHEKEEEREAEEAYEQARKAKQANLQESARGLVQSKFPTDPSTSHNFGQAAHRSSKAQSSNTMPGIERKPHSSAVDQEMLSPREAAFDQGSERPRQKKAAREGKQDLGKEATPEVPVEEDVQEFEGPPKSKKARKERRALPLTPVKSRKDNRKGHKSGQGATAASVSQSRK